METQQLLSHIDTAIASLKAIRNLADEFPADNYNPISATTIRHIAIVAQNLDYHRGDIACGIIRDALGYVIESDVDVLAVAAARRDDAMRFIEA